MSHRIGPAPVSIQDIASKPTVCDAPPGTGGKPNWNSTGHLLNSPFSAQINNANRNTAQTIVEVMRIVQANAVVTKAYYFKLTPEYLNSTVLSR